MIFFAIPRVLNADEVERTPAIFRCSTAEAESKFFEEMVNSDGYDTYCIEPKPGPSAKSIGAGKVKFIAASFIDTKPNLAWRNATMDFVKGKISPQTWLNRVHNLKETVHFLSSPGTPKLRPETGEISHNAVFAEMLLLSWPGKPCLNSDDTGGCRYLPGPGRLESWILAMNDYLGPMLYQRATEPAIVTHAPTILRADNQPGLLEFSQKSGGKTIVFYFNNGKKNIPLPNLVLGKVSINIGLNLDGPKPEILPSGFLISEG